MLFLKLFVIAGLVKFLIESEQPFVCAALFTLFRFVTVWLGYGLLTALAFGGAALVVSSAYFWLLDKTEGSGVIWWVVFVAGLPIVAII